MDSNLGCLNNTKMRALWKAIWDLKCPSKIKYFMWKACRNILPIKHCLQRQKVITYCKVVGCASGVGLLPAALGPSFLDKGVDTGSAVTQVGPACAQTKPGLLGTCLR